jgi:hypothetical protein
VQGQDPIQDGGAGGRATFLAEELDGFLTLEFSNFFFFVADDEDK